MHCRGVVGIDLGDEAASVGDLRSPGRSVYRPIIDTGNTRNRLMRTPTTQSGRSCRPTVSGPVVLGPDRRRLGGQSDHSEIEMRPHHPAEERDRTRMRRQRGRLVPGVAAGPREGVVDAGIDVDLDILTAGKGLADLGERGGRDELVLAGELQQERAFDLGNEVELLLDGDPVIADRWSQRSAPSARRNCHPVPRACGR
jgi:hypothetical protein